MIEDHRGKEPATDGEPVELNDGSIPPTEADGTVDILYLVDRLEELVGIGKRVPFSGRVMVEEEEFLALVDQLRITVPNEIKHAQRIIKQREGIIGSAQEEATKILDTARQQAEYIVSQQGLLNEARQRGEQLLQEVEAEHKRAMGQIDVYALQQFSRLEEAVQEGMKIVMDALQDTASTIEQAKRHVGQ